MNSLRLEWMVVILLRGKRGLKNLKTEQAKIYIDIMMHIVVSFSLGSIYFLLTNNWRWSVLIVVGGILIDVDHLLDYFLYYGTKLNLENFMCGSFCRSGKIYLFMHSWELIILLSVGSIWIKLLLPLCIGMGVHLIIDQLGHKRKNPLFYFLIYRICLGFDIEKLLPGKSKEEY